MELLTYLAAAYPNQKPWQSDNDFENIVSVWHDMLYVFPAEVAMQAAKNYIKQGNQFFPSVGSIVGLCDTAWQNYLEDKHAKHIMENRSANKEAATLLFHAPLNTFADDYVKKSVNLIRRVCDGDIKFMSEEWKQEFKAIYGDNFCPRYGTER